jgi:hypothetical protein
MERCRSRQHGIPYAAGLDSTLEIIHADHKAFREGLSMLSRDYYRFAMGVDKLSRHHSKRVIGSVLDKYKQLIGANIAAVWVRIAGQDNVDFLQVYVDRGDGQGRNPEPIALTDNASGLFAWVAEHNQPLWLSNVPPNPELLQNCLYPYQKIDGRYIDINERTRSFVALPIEYKNRLTAILAVEAPDAGRIQEFHVESLKEITRPTGILIWKADVFEDSQNETEQIVSDFQVSTISASTTLNPYRTGFVARPYSTPFHLIGKVIADAFEKRRIKAAVYEHTPGSGLVMAEMLAQISSSHFGVADISSLSPNVIFELGALIAANKPVIILRDSDDNLKVPFDITGYQCYRYQVSGNGIFIVEPQSLRALDDFVGTFIQNKLLQDPDFQRARDWVPSSSVV